jgi:MYXO-CTERM domain-containing protein
VRCLLDTGDDLFVCKRWSFGKADRESGEFTSTFEFTKLDKILSCDGESTAAMCRAQLCSAYCGAAHFPMAPMCVDNYSSTERRGCAIEQAGAGGAGSSAAGSGGTGGTTAGSSGTKDAGAGTAGTSAGKDGSRAGNGDESDPDDGGGGGDGGCTVSAHDTGSAPGLLTLLGLVASTWLARRRRSARRR